jgi:hypothetical protein
MAGEMHSSQVKFGKDYAISKGGDIVRFRVNMMTSVKTATKTVNTFGGHVYKDDGKDGGVLVEGVQIGAFKGEFEQFHEMVANRKRREEEAKRAEEELVAKQRGAVDALMEFIGEEPYDWARAEKDYNYSSKKPVKLSYGHSIEISGNVEVIDALVTAIHRSKK